MKLLLLVSSIAFAQAVPNKIHLAPTKADIVAITSAHLIEFKFKIQEPKTPVQHWYYLRELKNAQDGLSRLITY